MTQHSLGDAGRHQAWRVRLRDAGTGDVLGAGVLIDRRRVLSCAHVVGEPDRPLLADLLGVPGQPSVPARSSTAHWVPERADGRGDLTLIELSSSQPADCAAPLHRLPPTVVGPVSVCGFPAGVEDGLWVQAVLRGPSGEWSQLDSAVGGPVIERGFSGAGVQETTGTVIGIVVTRVVHGPHVLSYMLPVESILQHLPVLAPLVDGEPAIDPSLPRSVGPGPGPGDLAGPLADWLAGNGTQVWTVLVGDADGDRSAELRRALTLSDREWPGRDAAARRSPAGTVPPVGSVDLALDVTGLTVRDVRHRVVDRLRVTRPDSAPPAEWLRTSAPAVRLVIEGIDAAVRPEELVTEVLGPLVDRGGRVLLALRRPASAALAAAVATLGPPPAAVLRSRLDQLEAERAQLDEAERAAADRAARLGREVTDVPVVQRRALELGPVLATLRYGVEKADYGGRAGIVTDIETVERAVERARRRLGELGRQLDERSAVARTVPELRGLLAAYAARSGDRGVAEDEALGAAYRSAYQLAWQDPCDVPAATAAVQAYAEATRAELERRQARR